MDTLHEMLGLNREADWETMRQAFIARKKQLQQQMLSSHPEEARAAADALTALVNAYAEAKKQAGAPAALPPVSLADKTVSPKEGSPADHGRKLQAEPAYTVLAAGTGKGQEKKRRPGRSFSRYWQSGKAAFQSAGRAWQIAGGLLGAAVIVLVGYAGYMAVDRTSAPRKLSDAELQGLLPAENEVALNYADMAAYLINQYRGIKGVQHLHTVADMNKAADIRAEELSSLYSLKRPDGSEAWDMFGGQKYSLAQSIGEGVEYPSVEAFITNRMKDRLFRKTALNDKYNQLGVGHYYEETAEGKIKHYWVLLYRGD